MVTLVAHDPSWQSAFRVEAARIRSLFGASAVRIDHVGSTSVPGLLAKPVIDIQVSLQSPDPRPQWANFLAELGYRHVDLGPFDMVYPFFTKPDIWPCTHHVHLCAVGSLEERNHLAFRDYLRLNPTAATEYERLKRALAADNAGETLDSQERYSLAKTSFVDAVLERALRNGLPIVAPSDG